MLDVAAIELALDGLRPGFAADGFDLRVGPSTADGCVQVIVEAKPDACLECLVPDGVLIGIVEGAIREQGLPVTRIAIVKRGFDDRRD
jgi:hypothetical protein